MNRRGSLGWGARLASVALITLAATAPPDAAQQRGQAVQIVNAAGKCLDVHAPDQNNNGARVQLWTCNGSRQQDWFIDRNALRTAAGKCLDVYAPDQDKNGARAQIWDCNGTPQQRWSIDRASSPSQIRSGAGKCLDVHAPDQRKDGGIVQVWDCNGTPQQRWSVRVR